MIFVTRNVTHGPKFVFLSMGIVDRFQDCMERDV
jgi:hypothetical protein